MLRSMNSPAQPAICSWSRTQKSAFSASVRCSWDEGADDDAAAGGDGGGGASALPEPALELAGGSCVAPPQLVATIKPATRTQFFSTALSLLLACSQASPARFAPRRQAGATGPAGPLQHDELRSQHAESMAA